MIGLCTDSGARLPGLLVQRYDIEIVPLTLRLGDEEYLDGVDAHPAALGSVCPSTVAVAPPSPGQFALAYERLAERGVTEILSIHGGNGSGPLGPARLAAKHSPVPVRLVDPGTVGFGVGCATWAAAERLATGADLDAVIAALAALEIGSVALTPVNGGTDCAAAAIAREALSWRDTVRLNVAVGAVDASGEVVRDAVCHLLRQSPQVNDVVAFRIGPCEGAGLAPGSTGAYFFPA